MVRRRLFLAGAILGVLAAVGAADRPAPADLDGRYQANVRPLMTQYCLKCHSTQKHKGDLDLERFTSMDAVRKDVRAWQNVLEMVENGEMPPKEGAKLPAEERKRLAAWVRDVLTAEAHARAGDPGRVVVRRLSNAEYNNTVRDLTGVDLQPAREFPVDGAAGEGFTNAGDALVTSPTLLNKYLAAAKEIAAHAVFLPDGLRFSPAKSRRDWTDEILAELRRFYGQYASDGKLPLRPYLDATVRYRNDLARGQIELEAVAAREKLNPKYLHTLWQTLTDSKPSYPLDSIRERWRQAKIQDVDGVLAEIAAWQAMLWRFVPIGSYRYGNTIRQLANDPVATQTQTVRLQQKPAPGQNEVVLYLSAREFPAANPESYVIWNRPRFEGGKGPALLLRDYAAYGAQFEVDYQAQFADTGKYLAAALEAAKDRKASLPDLAARYGVDGELLKSWIDLLALSTTGEPVRRVPLTPVELLDYRLPKNPGRPAINGWTPRGADLPVVLSNSSEQVEYVPGRVSPHRVTVHPTPTQFVAVAWKSPLEGRVRVTAKIVHAHPGCGNGLAWWLEQRLADHALLFDEGVIDVGKQAEVAGKELNVSRGDLISLAIDPRDGEHSCDLTEVTLTITGLGQRGRVWDLAGDVADTILADNPHADKLGNQDVWRFVRGPAKKPGQATSSRIPRDSVLDRWRKASFDPAKGPEVARLARDVQTLLTGPRPGQEKSPDRLLYDSLVTLDSPLLQGIDLRRLPKAPAAGRGRYGVAPARFGPQAQAPGVDQASLVMPATSVLEVRLPAALFRDRAFVVDTQLTPGGPDRVVQSQVLTTPATNAAPDFKTPFVTSPGKAAFNSLVAGFDDFRRCFPQFICYSRVIPDDEVVCLKLFHREDEPLRRLFLDEQSTTRLERLWRELRFVSQFPVTEHKQLPLFIGFVTQDQPKELLAYFESQREPFRKRAEEFENNVAEAAPRQLAALADLAAKAYRRPLHPSEKKEINDLYAQLRTKGLAQEEALRTVLTRILISPSFLFRIEEARQGKEAQLVSDWELASRLSYFLWAGPPDEELRRAAASKSLQDPQVLRTQMERMLREPKIRGLAEEFATQWLHVRDIQQNREKNEKLFPTYNDGLRQALFEESVLFTQHLFQGDRPFHEILDADYTYLNETLAKHYGIPGVVGPEWRRVDDIKKYGRGGVLTLASVLTKQSGASRTSPVLRGNWLVETMLGEKLPKPPPEVPRLPEAETGGEATVRQMVEKHVSIAACAVCHQRIDPFGFALEHYDPIGRFRDKDLGSRPVDARAKLKDGTQFEGVDGLRRYLLIQRRAEFERHFCQKLLGYALGRSVALSDQPLLDEMLEKMHKNEGRLSAAVLAIVQSKQFRYHRGLEATKDE
jgi:mono/diheme cytochrome c family protein